MPTASGSISAFVLGPTYPKELIGDAAFLAHRAQDEQARRPRPDKTSPNERAFARAAILTAVNALESFIIDLAQERIKTTGTCPHCASRINEDVLNQRANLSRTIPEWPVVLTGNAVIETPAFTSFNDIRILRNNLVHPKLEPLKANSPSQDDLLDLCNGTKARWVVEEVAKMLAGLCIAFGDPVPPEFSNPFGGVGSR